MVFFTETSMDGSIDKRMYYLLSVCLQFCLRKMFGILWVVCSCMDIDSVIDVIGSLVWQANEAVLWNEFEIWECTMESLS